MNSRATFSEIRSYVQAFMREIDVDWKAEEAEDAAFIIGRQAKVVVNGKVPESLEKYIQGFWRTLEYHIQLLPLK